MKVAGLYLYPVKGMRGVEVDEALTEHEGFSGDRRFMLVDNDGRFISQRTHPILTRFQPTLIDDNLELNYEGYKKIICIPKDTGNTMKVTVWDDTFHALPVNGEISDWLSEITGQPTTLVYYHKNGIRKKKVKSRNEMTAVSFADGYPYLLVGTESLEELNRKLTSPIPMDRFRPNIVVTTSVAHEEDEWTSFRIGEVEFLNVKPCARCQVPTIDQQSGERSEEPLKTLSTYRLIDRKILFGTNLISMNNGVVRIGDELTLSNK